MKKTIFVLSCIATMLVSACACSDSSNKPEGEKPDVSEVGNGDVKVLTTTASRTHELKESYLDFSKRDNMSPSTVRLDPNTVYQTMDGFGAAITGSTCYNLMKMPEADRKAFLKQTFSPTEGYGFSYVRIAIGCSDFSLSEFTCCDKEGIENFALSSEDTDYIIPILKEILSYNPNLKIMGSPWTPPRWMKTNGQWTSGELNPKYYADYAQYFVKWVQAFKDHGIDIYSVTLQNEPLNRGNSASMYMPWQDQTAFLKHVGPAFKNAGLNTKIYAFDHNYNYDNIDDQQQYPLHIYQDSDAAQYLAGAAYHNYGGNKEELNNIHQAAPAKELVFTETSIGTWNDGRNLETRLIDDMREVAIGTVNRWCRGAIVWNLMLDTDRKPYRPGGCSTCYGAVDISTDYKHISRNSHYFIIAHMASVVAPGAQRIGSSGFTADGLDYAAFRNPDGSYALVACNAGGTKLQFVVDDGTNHFTCSVPARSVVSFKW